MAPASWVECPPSLTLHRGHLFLLFENTGLVLARHVGRGSSRLRPTRGVHCSPLSSVFLQPSKQKPWTRGDCFYLITRTQAAPSVSCYFAATRVSSAQGMWREEGAINNCARTTGGAHATSWPGRHWVPLVSTSNSQAEHKATGRTAFCSSASEGRRLPLVWGPLVSPGLGVCIHQGSAEAVRGLCRLRPSQHVCVPWGTGMQGPQYHLQAPAPRSASPVVDAALRCRQAFSEDPNLPSWASSGRQRGEFLKLLSSCSRAGPERG